MWGIKLPSYMGIIINHYKCLLNKVPDVLGGEHVKIQNFRDNHLGKGIFKSVFPREIGVLNCFRKWSSTQKCSENR